MRADETQYLFPIAMGKEQGGPLRGASMRELVAVTGGQPRVKHNKLGSIQEYLEWQFQFRFFLES